MEEAEGLGVVEREVRREGDVETERETPEEVAVSVGPGEEE